MNKATDLMAKRIKEKRLEAGLTQEELGKLLGVQRAAVNKYESGSVENIKRSIIKKMCAIFNVSPSWIMAIDEEINEHKNDSLIYKLNKNYDILSTEGKHNLVSYSDALVKNENEQVKEDTELYSVEVTESVAAGLGYRYGNNETTTYYTDRDDLKEYDYATLVSGNSMEPVYNDGDIILVKAGYDNSNGEVYVIDYDGKSYVKKLYNDGDRFRLVSINRNYENIIIDLPIKEGLYFNIVGKVIDCFTPVER